MIETVTSCQAEAAQTLQAITEARSDALYAVLRHKNGNPVDDTGRLFSLVCRMLRRSRVSDTNWQYTRKPIEYEPTHSQLSRYAIALCNSSLQ